MTSNAQPPAEDENASQSSDEKPVDAESRHRDLLKDMAGEPVKTFEEAVIVDNDDSFKEIIDDTVIKVEIENTGKEEIETTGKEGFGTGKEDFETGTSIDVTVDPPIAEDARSGEDGPDDEVL